MLTVSIYTIFRSVGSLFLFILPIDLPMIRSNDALLLSQNQASFFFSFHWKYKFYQSVGQLYRPPLLSSNLNHFSFTKINLFMSSRLKRSIPLTIFRIKKVFDVNFISIQAKVKLMLN